VVYATCTLAPEENEAVLDTILGMYPGKVEVDDLSIEKNISAPALIKDGNRDFHPTIRNAFRLWPHTFRTAGFFAARLRKTQPIPQESGNFREKTVPGERPVSLPKSEVDSVVGLLLSAYGIDLELILNLYQLLLVKKKDTILLLPGKLGGRIPTLKFITAGMSLAEITPSGLEISHDFCSRFGKMIPAGWAELPEILNAPWLRGEDIPRDSVSHLPANRIILLRNSEGEYIGRGRVTSDRIKNLLPRRVLL
jgi:16S rRNA (cytosine1407-C5)-methyltransferase